MSRPEAALEQDLFDRPDSVRGLPDGPRRFDIQSNLLRGRGWPAWRRRLTWLIWGFPYMQALRSDIAHSFISVAENPADPRTTTTAEFLDDFARLARSLGIGAIGYTGLPPEAIFQDKAVLYTQAIVLVMEMDAQKIGQAPSRTTYRHVMQSYYELGRAVEELVGYLRQHQYAAQGGHPLNGVTLYPLIAQRAGLGGLGDNGLLITPQYGPRHRLAAIYTSIANLPDTATTEHDWVTEFCAWCRQCIRKCPSQAIYEQPIRRQKGLETHIDVELCFPVFADQYGCSICIKVCPFNLHTYEQIRERFARRAPQPTIAA